MTHMKARIGASSAIIAMAFTFAPVGAAQAADPLPDTCVTAPSQPVRSSRCFTEISYASQQAVVTYSSKWSSHFGYESTGITTMWNPSRTLKGTVYVRNESDPVKKEPRADHARVLNVTPRTDHPVQVVLVHTPGRAPGYDTLEWRFVDNPAVAHNGIRLGTGEVLDMRISTFVGNKKRPMTNAQIKAAMDRELGSFDAREAAQIMSWVTTTTYNY